MLAVGLRVAIDQCASLPGAKPCQELSAQNAFASAALTCNYQNTACPLSALAVEEADKHALGADLAVTMQV